MNGADARLDFSLVVAPNGEAPIVYLPVRHHSPACAYHVDRVIRALRPAEVLIEGPRDANPLIPHLVDRRTQAPVALYATFIDRRSDESAAHHGAYYPLADYSPELVALRTGADVGADLRFIDLAFPEWVVAQETAGALSLSSEAVSLQGEADLRRRGPLKAVSRRVGARDPDDLWDCLFEHDFRRIDSTMFFHRVLAWCALAWHTPNTDIPGRGVDELREQAMRAEIDDATTRAHGRPVVVVTGGVHSLALPTTQARRPNPVTVARAEDARVHLIRFGFEQLNRLNGYASGMPSPEFYQRLWEGRDPLELLAEIARELRGRMASPSTAEVAMAFEQVRRLASFRDHGTPTREDLLDGVRSVFIKGTVDIEGVAVLSVAHKSLAGQRKGDIPAEVDRSALVLDFERTAAVERISLDPKREHNTVLDLYRSSAQRRRSRVFHRLRLLDIPFATWVRGPDFVSGQNMDRVTEAWRYRWRPQTEARLVEQSKYGATVKEAAAAILHERFSRNESADQSSKMAAELVLEAYCCGLHEHAPRLLSRTASLLAMDPDFASVVSACFTLDLLRLSRKPLEAHNAPGLEALIVRSWERGAVLVPHLDTTAESDESAVLDSLCTWSTLTPSLPDNDLGFAQRRESLVALTESLDGNPVLLGGAYGLRYGNGELDGKELAHHLSGYLCRGNHDPARGARFLRGVLRAARSVCWQEPTVVDAIHEALGQLTEEGFVVALPHLRLAFSALSPQECDLVAASAAARCGVARLTPVRETEVTEAEILLGVQIDLWVSQILDRDGWSGDA